MGQGVGAARSEARTRPLDAFGDHTAFDRRGHDKAIAAAHASRGSNTAVCGEVQKGQRPFWDNLGQPIGLGRSDRRERRVGAFITNREVFWSWKLKVIHRLSFLTIGRTIGIYRFVIPSGRGFTELLDTKWPCTLIPSGRG